MPLSAAERAKRYRKKNKDVVTNKDNLYRKVQRLTMKVMDPIKNAERLKNRELPKLYTVKKREEMEASISQLSSTSTTESSQCSTTEFWHAPPSQQPSCSTRNWYRSAKSRNH